MSIDNNDNNDGYNKKGTFDLIVMWNERKNLDIHEHEHTNTHTHLSYLKRTMERPKWDLAA